MKINKQLIALSAIMLTTIFTACNKDNEEEQQTPRMEIQLTQSQKQIAENGNEFAIDAFKALNQNDHNILLAPYSLQQTLGMLANGAKGETLNEIINALHTNAATVDDLNGFYKTVTAGLTGADKKVKITLANAAWLNNNVTPANTFVSALKDNYNAETASIDFSCPNALATINNWASNATNGKINKVFDQLSPNTLFCIANAMTFEGKWAKRFESNATTKAKFTNWENKAEECDMMTQSNTVGISSTDDADMLELDYGNGSFVMDVILPKDGSKINDYVAGLSIQYINKLVNGVTPTASVIVRLPKFEAQSTFDLIENLNAIGIKKIFGGGDLSGITNTNGLAVTQYLQRSCIKVDEEGTKVTTVTASKGEYVDYIGGKFTVNSPFVYMIRERSTGVILAIGKVQTMAGMQ